MGDPIFTHQHSPNCPTSFRTEGHCAIGIYPYQSCIPDTTDLTRVSCTELAPEQCFLYSARLLMHLSDHSDTGHTVSTLPGNACITFTAPLSRACGALYARHALLLLCMLGRSTTSYQGSSGLPPEPGPNLLHILLVSLPVLCKSPTFGSQVSVVAYLGWLVYAKRPTSLPSGTLYKKV